jgi:hypothetical protein
MQYQIFHGSAISQISGEDGLHQAGFEFEVFVLGRPLDPFAKEKDFGRISNL